MDAPLILPTLHRYQRSWLGPDVLAGLTLVAIAVPEQMATARLAGMPAVTGLYAFIAGSLLFALLGRSGPVSVGADSTIAPVIFAGVVAIAAVGSPHYIHLVSLLALMVGVIVIVVGLLRLGWISEFLSTPVVTGVLAGIAIEILVRQLPSILGLAGGGTTTIGRVRRMIDEIGHTNSWSLGIAVAVFGAILLAERINHRIPGALIGLIASIVVVALGDLKAHGVAVLGAIHGGLPSFGMPTASWADFRHLVAPALTIAFVCLAQTAATARASGTGRTTSEDFDRDLIAVGAGSLAAGLSGSFAVNTSPPRSTVVSASGGRSQLAGLVAAGIVLLVILVATGALKDLPQATLGAILLFVATRLFRVRDLASIWRFDRLEFALALITLSAVAFLGIEQGVLVAMLLSLAERTWRVARPRDAVLGREPGTDHWIPPDIGHPTEQVPGVVVYLLYAPLWYGNADYVRSCIREIVDSAKPAVRTLVLDAVGISDIDYTGARMLGELAKELADQGVATSIARSSHLVHRNLKRGGLLKSIGPDRLFTSVADAVAAATGNATGKAGS